MNNKQNGNKKKALDINSQIDFEKLKNFLENQEDDRDRIFKRLWFEKMVLLSAYLDGYTEYLKGLSSNNFRNHLEKAYSNALSRDSKTTIKNIYNKIWKDLAYIFSEEDLPIKVFESFLSPAYNPPENPLDILTELELLWFYYAFLINGSIPFSVTLRLDFVITLLSSRVIEQSGYFHKIARDQDRTSKSTIARRRSSEQMKKSVWKTHEDMFKKHGPILEDMSLNKRATVLKKELGKSSPHLNTIKRYLREYDEIRKERKS